MENDIKAILQKLDGLDTRLTDMDTRLTGLEQTVDHGFAHTAQQITNLAAKVTLLEQSMREQFAEVGEHIAGERRLVALDVDDIEVGQQPAAGGG